MVDVIRRNSPFYLFSEILDAEILPLPLYKGRRKTESTAAEDGWGGNLCDLLTYDRSSNSECTTAKWIGVGGYQPLGLSHARPLVYLRLHKREIWDGGYASSNSK